MGLREKVTITLVIIALIQIACRHSMPRTPRKASLKHYLNDLKPVKNNPVTTLYSSSRVNKTPKPTFGKTDQNGRISQNSLPKKSLYKTYNFPENEYPLNNSPRDPFRMGMNFNENNHVNTLQKASNLRVQGSPISDLKKEMKMKRKLLNNKQVNNENRQLKTHMSSIKFAPSPDPIRFLDSYTFPEVQYPLNTMDTWGPNYWNNLPFTQEKPFQRFGQQTFNPKAKEDVNQPTRLTKAKASKYLQSYDKLKEEHRCTITENSKRSNVGQTGLNFTKTATCERVSDDFITAGLVSNIPSNSTEMKKALTSSTKIIASSENTCPATEYPYHPVPIPYKVIENNNENISPALELKYNTEELADVDNSVIAQTLQLIQEILFNDDISSAVSPGNFSNELEKNMNTSDCSDVPENKEIPITLVDCGKNITITPSKESSQEVSDDIPPVGILQNNLPSVPEETIPENIPTVAGPLNVRMPLPFSEPLHEIEALTNTPKSSLTNMAPLSNGFAFPSSTSIIIIPMNNNAVGKSKSHMFETTSDTQITVYLPSTQTPSFNQTLSSSLDYTVPNNQLYNVLSNMAPLQNDNPFSPAHVSELLNRNSDSGSSLPIDETLPTNSMCYNNESSPSSMREKPVLDILIDKSLTAVTPFVTKTRDEKMSEQRIETDDLDVTTNTLPPIPDFEYPLIDFSGSEFTSLSHGPYNKVLNNELPIIAHEIDSDQEILTVSSKDLFIPTQNVTSEHLHKTSSMDSVSEDSFSEIPNDVSPVALDKNFSSGPPTDSIDKLKTDTLLPDSIPNLQEPVDTLTESLPQPIHKILLSTTLIEPPSAELPQPKESPLSPTPFSETFSDKLPEIMDPVLSTTPVSVTTTERTSQHIGNMPSTEINSFPMMTDMTLKTELYKIRQILDKMLSAETPTNSKPLPIDTTLLPIYDSDRLLLPINETPTESLLVPAVDRTVLPLPDTDSPIDSLRQVHETLPPMSDDATPTDTLALPGNKLVIPNKLLETDTPSLPIDDTIAPTLEFETSANNKPYLLDNLVTPLSETVTLRTKDTPDNSFSHKMEDFPLKMDLKFPNIYEGSSDDLPLSVDHLPTKVQPEHITNPDVSTNDLPTQVAGTPVSEVPVSDLAKPTDVLSLPLDEVLEDASLDVPTSSAKTLMSGFTDKLLQDFLSSKVPSDALSTLPMNVFKSPIHKTFPDGQFNEMLSTSPSQNDYLPSAVQKLIPDLCLSNALANEPSLEDDLPSHIINRNIQIPHSAVDTKYLLLEMEHFLSPENYVTPDSEVIDIPSAVSPSLNKGLQTSNLDQTSDEVLSLSTLSDITRDELTLPVSVHKMSPLTDDTLTNLPLPNNKTPTTSKLPITKALLENVLSDINKGGLSSEAKALPVKPHALLDKRLHYEDEKSPLSEIKKDPMRPLEQIFLNSEHTDNLIDYVPSYDTPLDTAITDLPLELLLPTNEMHKNKTYILTNNVEGHDKNETQYFANPTHDLPVPIETVSPPKDTTKMPSSSKLPTTKTLLENVLSDITTRGFSVQVAQSLPVTSTSPSVLDKTLYYVQSPISHITEDSRALPVDKTLPITSLSDHSTDILLPISIEGTLPIPIDKTFSELQCLDIPTEFSLSVDNMRPDIPNISMYDKEQDDSENPSSKNLTDDHSPASPLEGILSLSEDTPSDLTLPNNKTQSSSKLPITKALLENVLSDINTRGFSLPVAQALPVAPRSQLDKTVYFLETPVLSNMAPLQNDNPFSPAHVSELLNRNSDSGSSLPIDETLPTNSMCYNNESSPSSMREKPVLDILIDKSLTAVTPFVTKTRDEKMSEQRIETDDLDLTTNTLPPIPDFEYPLIDFSGSEFTSLSHGPYNNVLHNELPIIAHEIDSDQEILTVSSKDLFIPTQNVTSEHLHKTSSMDSVSEDSFSENPNGISPVALDKNFSSGLPTYSIDKLKTDTLLPDSIPNLQEPVDTLTESLPQPIHKILLSTTLIEPPSAELPQPKESPLSPTLFSETFSDKLPEIMDPVLSTTPVSVTTTERTSQHIGNMPSTEINSFPMMTDMTLKTELYKISQILDKMLSAETPTNSKPLPIDTTLLPIYDSDRLLLPINETPTESLLVPAVDKTVLPLPATDSPIDSLRQVHETLPPMSDDATPTDTLALPGNKLVIPNKLLETDTPSLPIDDTIAPTLEFETSANNKPYLLDNLVTPLSETVTLRTNDTPDNSFSHKMEDFPLKMDLKFPNIYEGSSDDLPLSVDHLPTKVQPEHITNPDVSTNDLPTQVAGTPVSEVPVSDLAKPTDVLSLPLDEVLEDASLDVPTSSAKTLMSGFTDKLLQDFLSSKVPSDALSTLPMNVFKSPIHETFPDGQFNEMLSTSPSQNDYLPSSVQKLIPDLCLSNALANEPSLEDDSPSLIINRNIQIPHSAVDTKYLPLEMEHVLSPENYVTPDSEVIDIPSAVSPSLNKGLQTSNLDQTSDEVLSLSTLSDITRDELTLPVSVHKMSPLTDDTLTNLPLPNNKRPTTSKLPITKALLENVLSDINKGGLSSVAKALPVKPHALLDKRLHYEDEKSPLYETKKDPMRPLEQIFLNSEHTDNLIDYVPSYDTPLDTAITDLPLELLLPTNEMHKNKTYILTNNVEDHDKNETQYFANPTHDLPVPIETVSPPKDTTKMPSSSKLPITKALLENVLSDITTRDFSVQVAQSLPVTSPSVLDKTLYYVESPISYITEDSRALPVDKTLPITSLSDHSTDILLPISIEGTLPIPIDKTFSELQCLDIPTEFSSSVDNMRPDIPNISMYDKEQDDSENPSSKNLTDDHSPASPLEGILSLSEDTPSDLTLPNNKTQSSSKLPITKALLENVLSDINTRGFSLPVAQALPVAPRSQLDKTVYFLETPASDVTEKSSVIPTDNFPSSGINEDVAPQPTDNTLPDNPILCIPTDKLLVDKIHNSDILTEDVGQEDNSEMLTDDVEDRDNSDDMTDKVEDGDICDNFNDDVKNEDEVISNILTDDVKDKDKSDIWSDEVEDNDKSYNWTDDIEVEDSNECVFADDPTDGAPSDLPLPQTKPYLASKIPITKALLELVLSDITDGGIHA